MPPWTQWFYGTPLTKARWRCPLDGKVGPGGLRPGHFGDL